MKPVGPGVCHRRAAWHADGGLVASADDVGALCRSDTCRQHRCQASEGCGGPRWLTAPARPRGGRRSVVQHSSVAARVCGACTPRNRDTGIWLIAACGPERGPSGGTAHRPRRRTRRRGAPAGSDAAQASTRLVPPACPRLILKAQSGGRAPRTMAGASMVRGAVPAFIARRTAAAPGQGRSALSGGGKEGCRAGAAAEGALGCEAG